MTAIFSKPKLPAVTPLPKTPSREDPEVEDARRKAVVAAQLVKGRGSTWLSGGAANDNTGALLGRRTAMGA